MQARLNFRVKTLTAVTCSILGSTLYSAAVNAQAPAPNPDIESVQITGTRIARDGYDMPTPVSVLGEEDIQAEAPASVAEFAMTLPSIRGSSTGSTSSGALSNGLAGVAALNLRALGTGRTLVLFDGQRSVVSAATGQVDTNTFPQALVQRVEVVTGGASSAYGSDAIAGVVNFILDKNYTGLKTSIEYGEATEYGAGNVKFDVAAGTDFAEGQGHLLFSAEMYDQEGIHYTVTDWQKSGYKGIINPDKSPGAPYYLVSEGIGISAYTEGGLITSGPLRGTYFGPGGSVHQLNYGQVSGQWMLGGDWEYTNSAMLGSNSLQSDDTRKSVFGRASWDLTPSIEVFAQGSYASYEGLSYYINPTDSVRTISIENPFIPQPVRDRMIEEGLTSFQIRGAWADIPASGSNNFRETTRFVIGANGDFDFADLGFTWDTYYQQGRTNTDEYMTETWSFAALDNAVDVVSDPVTGQPVCRSTLINPSNGCKPLNIFGVGVMSEEAKDYILGRPRRQQEMKQDVFAFNISTNDIEGWAGPIGIATGFEWRQESIDGDVDDKYKDGWKYGNYKVTTGKVQVAEAYVEAVVPLLEDLELNSAVRYTDYSVSGSVTTWKAGLTYQPIPDITFRLTQSRDIRAPNLSELFDAGTARTNAVNINGQSLLFVQNLQGTRTVKPEEADTFGFGIVLQPEFLPGFATSIDYYDVEVDGVIDFLSAQQVADACVIFGRSEYCPQLRYDSNGVLQFIDLKYENLNRLLSEGIDVEASYTFPVGPGDLALRFMATHYMKNVTDNGVTAINQAGSNLGNTPDWVYRMTARYTMGDWSFNLTGRGHSDGVIDNAFIECTSNCPASVAPYYTINDNSVKGRWFFDGYVSRDFELGDGQGQLFISVKNMFDLDPVQVANPNNHGAENNPGYITVNRGLNDVLGRNYRLGMRYEF